MASFRDWEKAGGTSFTALLPRLVLAMKQDMINHSML